MQLQCITEQTQTETSLNRYPLLQLHQDKIAQRRDCDLTVKSKQPHLDGIVNHWTKFALEENLDAAASACGPFGGPSRTSLDWYCKGDLIPVWLSKSMMTIILQKFTEVAVNQGAVPGEINRACILITLASEAGLVSQFENFNF